MKSCARVCVYIVCFFFLVYCHWSHKITLINSVWVLLVYPLLVYVGNFHENVKEVYEKKSRQKEKNQIRYLLASTNRCYIVYSSPWSSIKKPYSSSELTISLNDTQKRNEGSRFTNKLFSFSFQIDIIRFSRRVWENWLCFTFVICLYAPSSLRVSTSSLV